MKFFITLLIFVATSSSIFAQFNINSPFERQKEFDIHKDHNKHTQIKSYFYPDSISQNKERTISVTPLFSFQQNYDTKNNYLSSNYRIGFYSANKISKNIYLNIIGFYGLLKPQSFSTKKIDSLGIIPGYGRVIDKKNNYFQYGNIIGNLIYAPQEYINFEIGKGKTFIGDGYRSLLLSNNSSPYPYFKTTVEVWKVKYLYMIGIQKDIDSRFADQKFTRKYTFTHYLSFNIGKRLNFSMFETVVTSPYDSLMAKRGLELNYLNPVIFMRSIEYSQGSPDNVLVGLTGHLKIFKSGILYGQIFIDEFILSHIKSSDEYWDEKYGIQAGMKFYKTFGITNLYTQGEINLVRPYTYSHKNPIRAYGNMQQPLAHPLGSNFQEAVAIIAYQLNDFIFQTKIVYARYGENDTTNYGRNPHITYSNRPSEDNVLWLQGVPTSLKYADFLVGYSKWGIQFSTNFIYRNVTNRIKSEENLMIMFKIETPLFNNTYDWN